MRTKRHWLRLVIPWIIGICCAQLTGLAGCRIRPGTTPALSEYSSLLRARTKKAGIYKGLDTVLLVSVTYRDWPLRQAYTQKYAADHQLTPPEEQRLLEEQKKEQEKGYEFVVATFTDNERWNGLDKGDSIWSVYLVNSKGMRVKPIYIKRQKPVPIYVSEYYPYFSPWKRVYKILFPSTPPLVTEDTKQITLLFTSVMGKVTLDWEL